jgi:2-polyprenyl-3-methyl-5-hydroxy-6-metoxy-1,4-benzoquinol methylase
MTEQYDEIGADYEGFKTLPMARYPEQSSFLDLLGDVTGKSVIDLACGTGFYTRSIRRLGSAEITGVDISQEMIDHAKKLEANDPLGIDYAVADVSDLPQRGRFDIATAVYLLNYAFDFSEMERMCQGAHRNLKEGGEFFVLTQNPDFSFSGPNATKYGFTFVPLGTTVIGRRVRITAQLPSPISFETSIVHRVVYEDALSITGFRDIDWVPLDVPDAAVRKYGSRYWDDFRANPPLAMLRCRR